MQNPTMHKHVCKKLPRFEIWVFRKKHRKIIVRNRNQLRTNKKYNIDYLEAQKILLELVKEKITIPFYRLEILGKSEHEDFDTLSEIPDTYELNDEIIEAPLEHIYLLFKVSKK